MNNKCVFHRKNGGNESCAYTNEKKCCFLCFDFMAPIADIEQKDHFTLNENRRGRLITIISLIISIVFSAIALTISIFTYIYK
jgi:hypothetical protein